MSAFNPPPRPIPWRPRVQYRVVALHTGYYEGVGEVTPEDLQRWGETLSDKPININHASLGISRQDPDDSFRRELPYPENRTLTFEYLPVNQTLEGKIEISDPWVDRQILSGFIRHISVERIPGGPFTGLSLITAMKPRRDMRAEIIASSRKEVWSSSSSYSSSMASYQTITSFPREVKPEGNDFENGRQLVKLVQDTFNLSYNDMETIGPAATARLGVAALHMKAADTVSDPTVKDTITRVAALHIMAAAADRMIDNIKAAKEEACQKLEVVNETCDDPDCIVAGQHSHGGGE